ncbi:MAG: insulinase family protein [Acidobacteria bacterium]|nr:insulinase family protein [Acidobacteriota bacterium]
MKTRLSLLLITLAVTIAGCATSDSATTSSRAAGIPDTWTAISTPELRSFDIAEPKRIELSNGLVIFLQEDHEVPLIKGIVTIRGGERNVPGSKAGLTDVYGQAWRTGGTTSMTGDEIDEMLEARAAIVETYADVDSSGMTWDSLTEDFETTFGVAMDLLQNPEFREEKIGLAKNQVRTGIARRNDNPAAIASREARKLVYGTGSPYARNVEYDTLAAVDRDDLIAFHERTVHPNNMIIGIVGDFDPIQMESRLRRAFGDWDRGPEIEAPVIALETADPGVYFIPKNDVTQSNIRIVAPGALRDDPNYYALRVMNEIFGGGFSARLFSRIRSDRGLAYSVGGGVGTAYDHPGLFQISMGTKSGTTLEAIKALYGEIESFQAGPIEEAELTRARESLLNSFIFSIDSKEEVLREKMTLEFYGYPLDMIDRFQSEISSVTLDDVQRVARDYIDRENLAVVVVGKADDFDADLSTLGPVTEIDIAIPEPGSTSMVELETDAAGQSTLDKVVRGLGGAAAVDRVRSIRRVADINITLPQGQGAMSAKLDSVEKYPGSFRQTIALPMGQMTTIVGDDVAVMMTPGGNQALPAAQRQETLKQLTKSPINIVQHRNDAAYRFSSGGTQTIDGRTVEVLDVDAAGVRIRWFVDPRSGYIVRSEGGSLSMMGTPVNERVDYSDFRNVEGIVQPYRMTVYEDGNQAASINITEIDVNPTVAPDFWMVPSN